MRSWNTSSGSSSQAGAAGGLASSWAFHQVSAPQTCASQTTSFYAPQICDSSHVYCGTCGKR
eukprot:577208-Pyramimonas_sp.AAC.1